MRDRSPLERIYFSYGGIRSLVTSGYLHTSIFISLSCWRLALEDKWTSISQTVLPTLAGFSVAAYALFFAVLSEKDRSNLRTPAPELKDRSPLLILASKISHATIVQIFGVIFSIIFMAKPLPIIDGYEREADTINMIFSMFGILLLVYGTLLVISSISTVYTMIELKPAGQLKKSAPKPSSTPPVT